MRLKLRGKKNRKGQKVWAIYQVFGSREKLHKRLGPVPKELAETVLKKELVSSICRQENIRQNQDIALEKVFEEYLDLKAKPPHKSERTYKEECATSKRVLKHLKYLWGRQNPSKSQKLLIHDLNLNMLNAYKTFRRESGKSHRTINIELCLIRAALKHAIEQNYLARFNFELFKNLPEEAPIKTWLRAAAAPDQVGGAAPRRPGLPPASATRTLVYREDKATGAGSNTKLQGGERKILTVLAQYPAGRTKSQVALLAGYAPTGGGFNN